jgi:hypothetical protein
MIPKTTEKGQALVLIALAAVALFAFAALAIDGSRVYSEKRHAQNAADTAAMAGALAYTRASNADKAVEATIHSIILDAASKRALSNGYYNDGEASDVVITAVDVPDGECPGDVDGKDITVDITFYLNTTFARVIGRNQVTGAVTATSRACGFYVAPLFDGAAIVGLNPTSTCAFDTGTSDSVYWRIKGSGVFSNGCAYSKNNDSVEFDPGECAESVGSAHGFTCQHPNQTSKRINYPDDVLKIMPPNPCDGTPGDIGITPPAGTTTFTNGVYCISDMDAFDKKNIVLNNATLYVTDTQFNLKYAGDGGFYGTPTEAGTYTGSDPYDEYYMIIAYTPDVCTSFSDNHAQVLEWRGNGSGAFYGTILAPSACLDLRGNGEASGLHSQVIGYIVGSNGTADVLIDYQVDENHQNPVYPTITMLK